MAGTQKIIPHIWFDEQAEEAANHYVSVFADAEIDVITRTNREIAEVAGHPEGAVLTVSFRVADQAFAALNGGPIFELNPAISFFVNCSDAREVDALFDSLAAGGTVLMPLQEYPFSERYAWVQDRFGVTWQLNAAPRAQRVAPCLMFVGAQCGRAEEAMQRYAEIFPQSGMETVVRWEAGEAPNTAGTIKHAIFSLAGQEFRAMDSAFDHAFAFNEALSMQVVCETQEEIDHYWECLADGGDPQARRCGWLKDRFGVSWQIVPTVLFDMLNDADPRRVERVSRAFLQMEKFDLDELQRAFDGEPA